MNNLCRWISLLQMIHDCTELLINQINKRLEKYVNQLLYHLKAGCPDLQYLHLLLQFSQRAFGSVVNRPT